jgi:anti-sigma factor RsiW
MNHITDDDLIDYLHDEVSDALGLRIHDHLAGCGSCRARCDDEAAVGEMLRSSALASERELPGLVRAQVWAAVRDMEPTFFDRVRGVLTPFVAVPLAAMLALVLYLGVPVIRGAHATGAPSVAAVYYFEEHAAEAQENPLADHVNPNASLAAGPTGSSSGAPLIDAADAATLDDVVAARP